VPFFPSPPFTPSGNPRLHFSYAITTNSCINVAGTVPGAGLCGTNSYTYTLYNCVYNESIPVDANNPLCPTLVATHNLPIICQTINPPSTLEPCSRTELVSGYTINTRYMCAITGGPDPPTGPTEDAYIEWHWYYLHTTGTESVYFNGKFIFVANAAYIASQYANQSNTYVGISGSGIGMFNPSNHTA
jgi:hypothetical protein